MDVLIRLDPAIWGGQLWMGFSCALHQYGIIFVYIYIYRERERLIDMNMIYIYISVFRIDI